MAEQDSYTVAVSLAHDQASFRLFELPDELLQLLTSDDAPSLELKSSPATAANSGTPSTDNAFAVLCTPDSTYNIRQVQTSNSIYIADATQADGITAIATCPATIELSPASSASASATASSIDWAAHASARRHLRALLPEWDDEQQLSQDLAPGPTAKHIYDNIPLSRVQLSTGWCQLCAFEHHGCAYRPTPHTLLRVWRGVLLAAAAERGGVERVMTRADGSDGEAGRFWRGMAEEEGVPLALLEAIVLRVSDGAAERVGAVTAVWLASVMLESDSARTWDRQTFLAEWLDLLPEQWRCHASLDAIKELTDQSDPTTVVLRLDEPVCAQVSTTTAATAGARKWHERLKKGK